MLSAHEWIQCCKATSDVTTSIVAKEAGKTALSEFSALFWDKAFSISDEFWSLRPSVVSRALILAIDGGYGAFMETANHICGFHGAVCGP